MSMLGVARPSNMRLLRKTPGWRFWTFFSSTIVRDFFGFSDRDRFYAGVFISKRPFFRYFSLPTFALSSNWTAWALNLYILYTTVPSIFASESKLRRGRVFRHISAGHPLRGRGVTSIKMGIWFFLCSSRVLSSCCKLHFFLVIQLNFGNVQFVCFRLPSFWDLQMTRDQFLAFWSVDSVISMINKRTHWGIKWKIARANITWANLRERAQHFSFFTEKRTFEVHCPSYNSCRD